MHFLTGATGFIGGRLAAELARRGQPIRCLVRASSDTRRLEEIGAERVTGDLSDGDVLTEAIRGCDVVYHLAGRTTADLAAPLDQINGQGTANVALACARQRRPPVLVYVSSVAAAGPSRRFHVRTPEEPPRPGSRYGRSKRLGEIAVERQAHRVPTTVVRPGIVFGPEDRVLLPMFQALHRLQTMLAPCYHTPWLSLSPVDDVVEIIRRAAERGVRLGALPQRRHADGGYYFACLPQWPSFTHLLRLIGYAVGSHRPLVFHMPEHVGISVAIFAELGRLLGMATSLTLDKIREATVASWACCPGRTFAELDFRPPRSLEQRLAEAAAWYQESGWL